MNAIILLQPGKIVFGEHALAELPNEQLLSNSNKILFLVATPLLDAIGSVIETLQSKNKSIECICVDIWGSDHAAWHFQYSASAFSEYCDRIVYGADDSYVYSLEKQRETAG